MFRFYSRKGFTLIELLVVIAIIAILVAMLLPAIQQVREAARKSQCADHLHNLGIALHDYEVSFKLLPPGYISRIASRTAPATADNGTGFAWGTMLLPFIEQKPLYDRLNLDLDSNDHGNLFLGKSPIDVFRCPSDIGQETFNIIDQHGHTEPLATANYVGMYGYGNLSLRPGLPFPTGCFYRNSATKFRDMTDGTSNIILVGERTVKHQFVNGMPQVKASSTWYAALPGSAPRPAGMAMASMTEEAPTLVLGHVGQDAMMSMPAMHHPPNTTNHIANFSSLHPGGTQFVMGDGKVTFISENVDYNTFRWLGQISDGHPVNVP